MGIKIFECKSLSHFPTNFVDWDTFIQLVITRWFKSLQYFSNAVWYKVSWCGHFLHFSISSSFTLKGVHLFSPPMSCYWRTLGIWFIGENKTKQVIGFITGINLAKVKLYVCMTIGFIGHIWKSFKDTTNFQIQCSNYYVSGQEHYIWELVIHIL